MCIQNQCNALCVNLTRPVEVVNLISDLGLHHDALLQLIDETANMTFTIYPAFQVPTSALPIKIGGIGKYTSVHAGVLKRCPTILATLIARRVRCRHILTDASGLFLAGCVLRSVCAELPNLGLKGGQPGKHGKCHVAPPAQLQTFERRKGASALHGTFGLAKEERLPNLIMFT